MTNWTLNFMILHACLDRDHIFRVDFSNLAIVRLLGPWSICPSWSQYTVTTDRLLVADSIDHFYFMIYPIWHPKYDTLTINAWPPARSCNCYVVNNFDLIIHDLKGALDNILNFSFWLNFIYQVNIDANSQIKRKKNHKISS